MSLPRSRSGRHSELHALKGVGLDTALFYRRLAAFGPNRISFPRSTIPGLLMKELFTGLYLYQFIMYSVWLWFSYLFVGVVELVIVSYSDCLKSSAAYYLL